MNTILPFYWPTRAITLDDDAEFVSTISECVSQSRKSEAYTNPDDALNTLNIQEFDFTWYIKKLGISAFGEDDFKINYNAIKQVLYDKSRYDLFSVLLVDYHMPKILGTEFCKKLNPAQGMRNILLTGNVEYKDGVNYLNQKQIDCFMSKKDLTFSSIKALVSNEEREFFKFHSRKLVDFLRSTKPSNPIFQLDYQEYFSQMLESNNIREYYMLNDLGWYLVIDNTGNKKILYLFDEEDIEEIEREALYMGVSKKICNKIRNKKSAICYYNPEDPGLPEKDDWDKYLHDIEPLTINGSKYFVSIVDYEEI